MGTPKKPIPPTSQIHPTTGRYRKRIRLMNNRRRNIFHDSHFDTFSETTSLPLHPPLFVHTIQQSLGLLGHIGHGMHTSFRMLQGVSLSTEFSRDPVRNFFGFLRTSECRVKLCVLFGNSALGVGLHTIVCSTTASHRPWTTASLP